MLPDVYIFNPTCEMAVQNGTSSFQPNARLQKFEEDLDLLPLPFTGTKDYLLVNKLPSTAFLKQFEQGGWKLPSFRLIREIAKDKLFQESSKGFLRPWGWSPAMHHKLKSLKTSCSQQFHQLPTAEWNPDHRQLYSRETALKILQEVSIRNHSLIQIDKKMYPVVCFSADEVQKLLKQWGKIVLKAPWSSSGRGIQIFKLGEWRSFHKQWIHGTIQKHGKIMVEPFLKKESDLAFQFYIDEKKLVRFLGVSWFRTNSNGQYMLNYINRFPPAFSTKAMAFFQRVKDEIASSLQECIQQSKIAREYYGYLGVDAMLIRDENDALQIHPCLEINLRYNMGILALRLGELVHPASKGEFHVFFDPKSSFKSFCREYSKNFPVTYQDGRFRNGFIPLTEPLETNTFGAWMILT